MSPITHDIIDVVSTKDGTTADKATGKVVVLTVAPVKACYAYGEITSEDGKEHSEKYNTLISVISTAFKTSNCICDGSRFSEVLA